MPEFFSYSIHYRFRVIALVIGRLEAPYYWCSSWWLLGIKVSIQC